MSVTSLPEITEHASTQAQTPVRLPRAQGHAAAAQPSGLAENPDEQSHNPIFDLLVQGEHDVTGLLAYSLYKQNKRDWLIAFQAAHGRGPSDAETSAFILGERLQRRITTYRRLAEDLLRHGDEKTGLLSGLMQTPANDVSGQRPKGQQTAKSTLTWRYVGTLLLALVAMAIVFRFAANWLFGAGR